jgi:hypothetical protein
MVAPVNSRPVQVPKTAAATPAKAPTTAAAAKPATSASSFDSGPAKPASNVKLGAPDAAPAAKVTQTADQISKMSDSEIKAFTKDQIKGMDMSQFGAYQTRVLGQAPNEKGLYGAPAIEGGLDSLSSDQKEAFYAQSTTKFSIATIMEEMGKIKKWADK